MTAAGTLAPRLEAVVGADALATLREHFDAPEVPLAAPADVEGCSELLRLARADGLRVLPVGRGSKLAWCPPAERVDFALSTRRLTDVVSFEPGDGTLTARAGIAPEALARTVGEHGYRLTPDVPLPGACTLGGVVAAGQSGFDRLRFGPLRNHVLGLRVVGADGTPTRSGGQLVKNVTGYDLHRLYCGSFGTLCVIVEASLRLFPAPDAELVLRWGGLRLADALEHARWLGGRPLRFDAVCVTSADGGTAELAAVASGRAAVLERELPPLVERLGDARPARGAEARAARADLRDAEARDGWPHLRVACPPSRLAGALEVLTGAARERGLAPRLALHPRIATADAWLAGGALDAELCARLDERLRAAGAAVAWRRQDDAAVRGAARGAPAGPARAWMRRLARALDPDGVFAAGRFPVGPEPRP